MQKNNILISISIILSSLIIVLGLIFLISNSGSQNKYIDDTTGKLITAAQSQNINEEDFLNCLNERKYKDKVEIDFKSGIDAKVTGTPSNYILYKGKVVRHIPGGLPFENMVQLIDKLISEIDLGTVTFLEEIEGEKFILNLKADDKYLGEKNKELVFLEFSDIDCPACRQFHPIVKQVIEKYKNQMSYVYRNFPLDSIHPQARKKAEATECIYQLSNKNNKVYYSFLFNILEN